MGDLTITDLRAETFELPLRNPFVIAVRSATTSMTIRWTLTTSDGEASLGESVPLQYVTGETAESVLGRVAPFRELLVGKSIAELELLCAQLEAVFPNDRAARAGVEMALYNAYSRLTGIPLYKYFGGKRTQVETDITIAKLPNAVDIARVAWADGFRAYKMKVGGDDTAEDLRRVCEVQEALPEARIRLDGNQGFSANVAVAFITDLVERGVKLEMVEQPVPKEDDIALDNVSRHSPVPVIADEACKTAEDAERLFMTTAVHGVNVKLMKSGLTGAARIVETTQTAGRRLMIGCMLESPVGLACALALACGTAAFDYVDLDGHLLLDLPDPITEFGAQGPLLSVLD